MTDAARLRRGPLLLAVTLLLAAALGIGIWLAVRGNDTASGPPAFVPGPGKFRVTAEVGTGNQPPQTLTLGTTKVTVAFGSAFRDHGVTEAYLAFTAPTEPGAPSHDTTVYRAGDTVTLGQVHVRVLAIYDAPGESHDAVDLQISRP